MRRRNTEINVFSMSALDLFACSLGVFVLLTVVFLPFFPNTGDHPAVSEQTMTRLSKAESTVDQLSKVSDAQETQIKTLSSKNETLSSENETLLSENVTLQSRLQSSENQSEMLIASLIEVQKRQTEDPSEEQAEIERPRGGGSLIEFPPLDVVIALDSTGSMRAQTEGLKTEITQFAILLRELSPSVGMGLVEYKDRCDQQTLRSFDLVEMDAVTIPKIQAFANDVEPGGDFCNSDGPEALKDALEVATQMNWRTDVGVQLIVIVTDNSAYPEEETEALELARAFAARGDGFSVGAAQVGADRETLRFLSELVTVGGGDHIRAGGSFTSTILFSLAGL